jgi:hypothetical protein
MLADTRSAAGEWCGNGDVGNALNHWSTVEFDRTPASFVDAQFAHH